MIGQTSSMAFSYMAAVVIIVRSCGLRIEACCRNQPYKAGLSVYKLLVSLVKQLYISNKIKL